MGKRVGTYAPHRLHVTAKVDELRPVPDGLDDEEAVFFTFADITMQGTRRGRLRWGDVAVVYGAGLIGQMVSRFVLFAGARSVFVVDVSDFRLSLLPKDHRLVPVNLAGSDLKALVAERTAGRMADVVYEATGNSQLIPQEFAALRVEGRMVLVSSPGGGTQFNFQELCGTNSYTIIGAHNRSHDARRHLGQPLDAEARLRVLLRAAEQRRHRRAAARHAPGALHPCRRDVRDAHGRPFEGRRRAPRLEVSSPWKC